MFTVCLCELCFLSLRMCVCGSLARLFVSELCSLVLCRLPFVQRLFRWQKLFYFYCSNVGLLFTLRVLYWWRLCCVLILWKRFTFVFRVKCIYTFVVAFVSCLCPRLLSFDSVSFDCFSFGTPKLMPSRENFCFLFSLSLFSSSTYLLLILVVVRSFIYAFPFCSWCLLRAFAYLCFAFLFIIKFILSQSLEYEKKTKIKMFSVFRLFRSSLFDWCCAGCRPKK